MKIFNLFSRLGRQLIQDPRQSALMLRMAGWVCLLSIAVKVRPLPKALGLLSAAPRETSPSQENTEDKLAAAIDSVLTTEVFCFRPICWKRAAVLHRYLALNGIATRIVFGMRKELNGTLHGHAWLESRGQPILEKVAPDYTVTYIFPSTQKFELELGLINQ